MLAASYRSALLRRGVHKLSGLQHATHPNSTARLPICKRGSTAVRLTSAASTMPAQGFEEHVNRQALLRP